MREQTLEIECKLTCKRAFVLEDLLRTLRDVATVGPGRVIAQVDRYYDSDTHSLAKAGLSARCRQSVNGTGGQDPRRVQIKPILLIPRMTFVRPELASAVPDAADPGQIIRELFESELGLVMQGAPVAQVYLDTRREVYAVDAPDCRAELCYDEVICRLPGGEIGEPFREVELELVEGRRDAFERLVDTMAEVPGLAPSPQSKYMRARQLLDLPTPRFGGPKVKYDRDEPSDIVARRIGAGYLSALLSYEPGTRVGLDPEHLHKMRVTIRRLRAACSTFGACFAADRLDRLAAGLKWLTGVLGPVRDLDVQLLCLLAWRRDAVASEQPGWDRLAQVLRQRRRAARIQLLKDFDSERYRHLLELAAGEFAQGSAAAAASGFDKPVCKLAARSIRRRARRFAAEIENRPSPCDPATVHRLRILGKKLRYTAELFTRLTDKRFSRRIRKLTSFQDEIGMFQDSIVAGRLAAELGEPAMREQEPAAYISVLGQLLGRSKAAAESAQERLDRVLSHLDVDRLLHDIIADSRRL
jgi:CHAD domain-containing protein